MSYVSPLRDMRFVLHELFDVAGHCELLGNGLDRALVDGVLEEGARYAAEVVAPLNRNSDEEGVILEQGRVTTPTGFRKAYRQYCESGWASMTGPIEHGGQGLPQMVACNFHEMLMRDSRITQLYEGTNGIQALDLIRRKLMGDDGAELATLQDELAAIADGQCDREELAELAGAVLARLQEWRTLSATVLDRVRENPEEIGACSVDFLQYSAYVLLAGLWLKAAACAQSALEAGSGDADFYQAKLHSVRFYVRRVLPRASSHREALLGGVECLMALPEAHFAF